METNEQEIWRDVVGYEGRYSVSNTGRLKSGSTNAIMSDKQTLSAGYVGFTLSLNGVKKGCYGHRLVALAFIPNPENKTDVNHINSVRKDNRVENLELCTRKENIQHGVKMGSYKNHLANFKNPVVKKLSDDDVREIRRLKSTGLRVCDIHRNHFPIVCQPTISNVINGRDRKNVK